MKKIIKIKDILISLIKYTYYYIYSVIFKINNSNTWLISERGNDARDNSYHLYMYIKKNHPEIDIRYVIKKESSDFLKINDTGSIIEYGSKEHYLLFLTAGKLISTHIMGYSPNMSLFWRLDKLKLLKIKGKKIFLQHGITQNYIEIMTSKVSKMDLFICGAKPEYDFILNNFGYDKNIVKYTGFSRYDNLVSNEKNQILLMPTFRKWLNYESNFIDSDYYEKYNEILNNEKLDKMLEERKMKLIFYPHYEIQKNIHLFNTKFKNIIIADFKNYDVQKLLIESKVLITDYSSVFFDFAYMKKPVIYYQFDIDRFRKNHYDEGYFKYDKDGFGPVVNNLNSLVLEIGNSIDKGVSDFYLKKINNFFEFDDKNNSKRIFEEINKL